MAPEVMVPRAVLASRTVVWVAVLRCCANPAVSVEALPIVVFRLSRLPSAPASSLLRLSSVAMADCSGSRLAFGSPLSWSMMSAFAWLMSSAVLISPPTC